MWSYFKHKPTALLVILLALWGGLGVVWAMISELSGSETYLWFVAQKLDFGYVDTSPLTAIFIWLGVAFGGQTAIGVRLLFTIALPLALYIFYFVVRRNSKKNVGLVVIYLLVAFSLPLLQIYGMFASEDICFILTTSLTLWAYDRYIAEQGATRGLLLGTSFALLLLSSSMGVFVLASILICRPKILLTWRFYAALLFAALLLSPFIWWQFVNSWPNFDTFMQPTIKSTNISFWEGLLSVFIWFNPLLVAPFLAVIVSRSKNGRVVEPMEMTMRVMFWVFLVAMLIAASRGALTGSWITPICFSIIYVLSSSAARNLFSRRYVAIFCSVSCIVLFLLRGLFMIEPSTAQNLGLVNNHHSSRTIADTLRTLGVEHLVLQNDERNASAINFYTSIPTTALASAYGHSSQYAKRLDSKELIGRSVAIEIGDAVRQTMREDSLPINFIELSLGSPYRKAYVVVEHDFNPTYDVRIEIETFPRKVLTGSRIAMLLKIDNPYTYSLPIGGASKREIILLVKEIQTGKYARVSLPFKAQTLGALARTIITTTVQIPTLETGNYHLTLSIERYPLASTPNSKVYPLQIVNPKSRI